MPSTSTPHDDHGRFVRLLLPAENAVRCYLRSLLRSRDEVEEVMQRASVVAWEKFDQLEREESFPQWLCGIARLEALNLTRQAARDRLRLAPDVIDLLADESPELENNAFNRIQQQSEALRKCLAELPSQQRLLLDRVYASGERMTEIAAEIGRSADALHQTVSRSRRRLADCVSKRIAAAEAAG